VGPPTKGKAGDVQGHMQGTVCSKSRYLQLSRNIASKPRCLGDTTTHVRESRLYKNWGIGKYRGATTYIEGDVLDMARGGNNVRLGPPQMWDPPKPTLQGGDHCQKPTNPQTVQTQWSAHHRWDRGDQPGGN